jgi:hypothetical protein
MATITTLYQTGTTHISRNGDTRSPYLIEREINYADALAAKGTALASADIIQALYLPAGTAVIMAGAEILVAGNSTTLTLGIGTGADDNEWVDALDGKATAGTYGTDLNSSPTINTYSTADTIDVTFQTLTGTLSTGKVRVYALVLDVSNLPNKPGIAVTGS